jgi:hypothetical protein
MADAVRQHESATALRKPRAAKPQKPLYFQARKALLIDHKTGEVLPGEVSVLAPLTQWDTRAMRDRGYKVGQTVRGRIERPRNPKFNGLAHALGALIVDHVEGFEGKDAHDALKKVQGDAGICCEESTIDASPLIDALLVAIDQALGAGARKIVEAVFEQIRTLTVKVPESIAFDSMPEERFSKLVLEVCQYVREHFHGVPPGELAEIIATVEEGHG